MLDYNKDGYLDLLIVEDRFRRGESQTMLLRNEGNLRFRPVNDSAGIPPGLFGLGCATADLNGDGRPEIFIGHSNRMLISQADDTYGESKELNRTFAWRPLDGEDWPCGAAFGDLNRDGLLDLVVAIHHVKARNRVYLNQGLRDGIPTFRDVTEAVGLATPIPVRCPHVEIQDFDNDGWPDLYFSAAWREGEDQIIPLIYHHEGVDDSGLPQFKAPQKIGKEMVYYPAGPSGDIDNDGRLDLMLINWFKGDRCRLLRNATASGDWLKVRVVGRTMNRMGIGAQVRVYRAGALGQASSLLGFQEIATGYGYASGQPAICHFGLGEENQVDLRVTLPDGRVFDRLGVAADQELVVREP